MGFFSNGISTLGLFERILTPLPAAGIIAAARIDYVPSFSDKEVFT